MDETAVTAEPETSPESIHDEAGRASDTPAGKAAAGNHDAADLTTAKPDISSTVGDIDSIHDEAQDNSKASFVAEVSSGEKDAGKCLPPISTWM